MFLEFPWQGIARQSPVARDVACRKANICSLGLIVQQKGFPIKTEGEGTWLLLAPFE